MLKAGGKSKFFFLNTENLLSGPPLHSVLDNGAAIRHWFSVLAINTSSTL